MRKLYVVGSVINWLQARTLLLAFCLILFCPQISLAQTFPTEIPKTKGQLAVMIKAILQKDAAFLKSFKTSGQSASAIFSYVDNQILTALEN